jgi:uncharacterized protein
VGCLDSDKIVAIMHSSVSQNIEPIARICESFGVSRLDLFGSAALSHNQPNDFDFLVQLSSQGVGSKAKRWIGLAESLEALLGRSVDLVSPNSIRNPHFQLAVEQSRVPIYAQQAT